jgi:twinkle protein
MNIIQDLDYQAWYESMEASVKVRPVADCMDQLIDEVRHPVHAPKIVMPWSKTEDLFRFRPGEITVYAGQNGSGKSMLTGQIALGLIAQGQKLVIASFEMKPLATLKRMVRQWSRMSMPTVDQYEAFKDWVGANMWFYDQQGTVSPQQVLGVGVYATKQLQCKHYLVDSLMKCVKGEDDYNGQKNFTDELCALARDQDMHVHLVHHIRKQQNDENLPTKMDLKGSGSIADQVDNVMLLHRNKKKERELEANGVVDQSIPDAYLAVEKQRNGEWEGVIRLWYDRQSQQYVEMQNGFAIDFCKRD